MQFYTSETLENELNPSTKDLKEVSILLLFFKCKRINVHISNICSKLQNYIQQKPRDITVKGT